MNVAGVPRRTLSLAEDGWSVNVIDQTVLPADFRIIRLATLADVVHAIRSMQVRGAPLIGIAAAYGICLALRHDPSDERLAHAAATLTGTRPTAVNLRWAIDRMVTAVSGLPPRERAGAAYQLAAAMADEDVAICERIGRHGEKILRDLHRGQTGRPLNVLTHCNAGWLGTIDWGTALAPIYCAHDAGIPVHVWVDETRPRNQGYLTAWELTQHGVPNTVVVDNAGGLLMQRGSVDVCLVGTDRVTRTGAVANKIGTYLKALAAFDNGVPFHVAAPSPSIDWTLADGDAIAIEERDPAEIDPSGAMHAHNPAFDVTPARLVTGLITERGACAATEAGLLELFPERRANAAARSR